MTYSFHIAARRELDEEVDYYEERESGLGTDFLEEVYAAVARILAYPEAWPVLSRRTRRCLVHRFPYGVVYQIKGEHIRILAIAHTSRRPDYWSNRTAK